MRLELSLEDLLVYLDNHYTTRGVPSNYFIYHWFICLLYLFNHFIFGGKKLRLLKAQLAWAVEYTDCFSAEG